MSLNRVQKLLFSEYCDFEDMVLIESPFAQTNKDGVGLKQVHLGLTPSKLILATDVLPSVIDENVKYDPRIDPEIETFELIAIYPVECVNLSIYRRKRRQAIKARFCNNRVSYFELGGFEKRGMFWNLWCEKVKFLCPGDSGSSRSETSVATSTTGSSLYLINKKVVAVNGIKQLWCKFGPNYGVDTHFINEVLANNTQSLAKKWSDKHLYLGQQLAENSWDYKPIMTLPRLSEFVKTKKTRPPKCRKEYPSLMEEKRLSIGDSVQVNRFGTGVSENCGTGLYLSLDDYIVPQRYSRARLQTSWSTDSIDWRSVDYEEMAETAVILWELYGFHNETRGHRVKHRRRYGFAPQPLFLHGFGPWNVTKGDKFSLQIKRTSSEVSLRCPREKELKLPVPKRHLVACISCPSLYNVKSTTRNNGIGAPKKPLIFFWTPGYSYRPITTRDAYEEVRKHLKKIREYQEAHSKHKRRRCGSRRFLKKFSYCRDRETDEDEDDFPERQKKRKLSFISNMLGNCIEEVTDEDEKRNPNETSLQHLKRILLVEVKTTSWDFDSTTLAQQLTMLDRDLFLKIAPGELGSLVWTQSSENSPNIATMIAFSYRICCLIASEILSNESVKVRARLMARFINVADKCHKMSNFQSCRSVLCGLQNPAIYRLRKTWAYVRKKHASKYQIFEFLCRLYRDPRMPSYQKTFFIFSQNPPFLPYMGHILAKLLNKVPEYKIHTFTRPISRQISLCTTESCQSMIKSEISTRPLTENYQNVFKKIFNVFSNPMPSSPVNEAGDYQKPHQNKRKKSLKSVKFKGLYEYYKPLGNYEDNREDNLLEILELLEKCQLGAVHYNFNCNEMARNFLLKSRHRDDQSNFYVSLCLESSTSSPNRINK